MSVPIFYGRLDFNRLSRHVARLDSQAARSDFLLSLVESLCDNEHGVNPLADEILGEAVECREAETDRKRKERENRAKLSGGQPRTTMDNHGRGTLSGGIPDSISISIRSNTTNTEEKAVIHGTNPRFVQPDMVELIFEFESKGSTKAEAERFYNFYESNGWRVGKNKMKKWKAAAANWISTNKTRDQGKPDFMDELKKVNHDVRQRLGITSQNCVGTTQQVLCDPAHSPESGCFGSGSGDDYD